MDYPLHTVNENIKNKLNEKEMLNVHKFSSDIYIYIMMVRFDIDHHRCA